MEIKNIVKMWINNLGMVYYKAIIKYYELKKIHAKKQLWKAVTLSNNEITEIENIWGEKLILSGIDIINILLENLMLNISRKSSFQPN